MNPRPSISTLLPYTTLFRSELVRVRRVALGFEPSGDKVRQGDGRTPEGDFYVCMKNDKSKFYLSLGLNYPNEEDAGRDRKSTRLNSSHGYISYAVFCLKKKN